MKVLIELSIPCVNEVYDVWMPDFIEIGELVRMIIKSIKTMSESFYMPSGMECLCLRANTPKLLKPGMTLRDYGVKNGDRLLLI